MKKLSAGFAFGIAVATAVAAPLAAAQAAPVGAGHQQPAVTAEQAKVADAARALGLGSGQRLQVKSVITDSDGAKHTRYQRTFQGIPASSAAT